MDSQPNVSPLVVILGETASGKSALGLGLAQQYNGEIIAADSRTVYKAMDIGTAKPSLTDQQLVPHHLLDVVTPADSFTAAEFKERAQAAIKDIAARGRVPFLVGGTGLYIDALIYDFSFRVVGDSEVRQQLDKLSVDELRARLDEKHISFPDEDRNPRHLVRALETEGAVSSRKSLRPRTLLIGIHMDRSKLEDRIRGRIDAMVQAGLIDELKRLGQQYGWGIPALQTPGYRAFHNFILGRCSLDDAKEAFVHNDMHLAKRQRTWFRRNESIHWVSSREEAVDLVTTFLNK
jgi:tRNA dimethylallyltransferase